MNILIFNDYGCIQGGAAQVAVASARGLAAAGNKVYFVFAVGPAAKELDHPNIQLVDLAQHDLLSHTSRMKAATAGIWNNNVFSALDLFLDSFSPDNTIAHIHTWVKSLTSSAVSVLLKHDIPIVATLHDYFTACPNGGFYNYQDSKVCTLKAMSTSCLLSNCDSRSYPQKIWRFARQIVTRYAGVPGKISHFIYVSEFSLSILRGYLPDTAKYWYVPNPIDIEKMPQATPSDSKIFTFIGRFSPEKGAQLFAQAAESLGIKTRFVGGGELLPHLREINPGADFTGWLGRDAIADVVRNSRAIVFPSYLYETQGMVVAEAAALGIPCIVSDACAGKDFVIDGVTGVLFKSGEIESLKTAISRLLKSPISADVLGQAAYTNYWQNPPTISRHVTELAECYNSILAARKHKYCL